MGYVFEVVEDNVVPTWLIKAHLDGEEIQVLTSIGWITVEDVDFNGFRNGVTYRVKP